MLHNLSRLKDRHWPTGPGGTNLAGCGEHVRFAIAPEIGKQREILRAAYPPADVVQPGACIGQLRHEGQLVSLRTVALRQSARQAAQCTAQALKLLRRMWVVGIDQQQFGIVLATQLGADLVALSLGLCLVIALPRLAFGSQPHKTNGQTNLRIELVQLQGTIGSRVDQPCRADVFLTLEAIHHPSQYFPPA